MTSVITPFSPVDEDLKHLRQNLTALVGAKHPVLAMAAEHLFAAKGKGIRPALVLLVARATMSDGEPTERHRRLAEITEMIHTASLVHDDVIDHSDVRRGITTVNADFGNRIAVLAGDFLFAQSSWYLANLDNLEVVKLLSQVIKDFAEGELLQNVTQFDASLTIETYIEKNYYKTASLMANSMKAAAVLSGSPTPVAEAMYTYGRSLGIGFQIIDDMLDFTSSTETLGKPAGSDLAQGHLTAPVLFAMQEFPQIEELIQRGLTHESDLAQVLHWVRESKGISKSQQLALDYSQAAAETLDTLEATPYRSALHHMTRFILERLS